MEQKCLNMLMNFMFFAPLTMYIIMIIIKKELNVQFTER